MNTKCRNDPRYESYKNNYINAIHTIREVELEQAADRKALKLSTDLAERKILCLRIARRRRGPGGLRALNCDISNWYHLLDEHHAWF